MSNEFPITKEQFSEWLNTQWGDNVVGRGHESGFCPLAMCVLTKGQKIIVQRRKWGFLYTPDLFSLPDWSRRFVARLDKEKQQGQPITAADARRILVEICGK